MYTHVAKINYKTKLDSISAFGDVFAEIGVKETQVEACDSFSKFGENHRMIEQRGIDMIKSVKPVKINC